MLEVKQCQSDVTGHNRETFNFFVLFCFVFFSEGKFVILRVQNRKQNFYSHDANEGQLAKDK